MHQFRNPRSRLPGLVLCWSLLVSLTSVGFAEVIGAGDGGFQIRVTRSIALPADEVYARFTGKVGSWWSADHTWSGDANNLSIDLESGRFLEQLPGGGYCEHLRVVHHQPGVVLRMAGGLGPLQEMGLNGVLVLRLSPDGDKTKAELSYNVSGFSPAGLKAMAPFVDQVLELQMSRFQRFCETGAADETPQPAPGR